MRRIIPIILLLCALCPHQALGQYVWVSQDNNTHYVDVEFRLNSDNPVLLTSEHQPALTYLSMVIDTYRDKIKSGEWKIWVESYVQQPNGSIADNRAAAKVMSNVVKSYMVYSAGLREEYFMTKNYSGTLNKRQGITSIIIGAQYPLDRLLPQQHIDWEASDLAWLTQTARTHPRVEVTVGAPIGTPASGTDTIQIELPNFEQLTFSYRNQEQANWKQQSPEKASETLLLKWDEVLTRKGMATWGVDEAGNLASGNHLGALEHPMVSISYIGSGWGAATKMNATRNAKALEELGASIEGNRAAIKAGEAMVFVDSYVYGDSLAPDKARAQARIQSNMLKSHLIATYGLTEANFSTRNHSGLFDNLSHVVMCTVASKQPTAYMAGLQTVDVPFNDASWRPGTRQSKYSEVYAIQEQAQMEHVNKMLTGMDLNTLTAPWNATKVQEVTAFINSAPLESNNSLLPSGTGIGNDKNPNIGVSSLGKLGSIIAENTPEGGLDRRTTRKLKTQPTVDPKFADGALVGATISDMQPPVLRRGGRRTNNEMSAYVDPNGKITIDATSYQRRLTEETQAQIAAENKSLRQAEERALRESVAYERRNQALTSRKAKGRFVVFGAGVNVLSSAALIPSIQVDTYFSNRFSAIVEGFYSKWNFSPDNTFNIEMISPELRFFPMGQIKQFTQLYVGLYGALGNYDLRWNGERTGIQSRFWSVGLSAGYILPLGGTPLYLDMGIAGGYVNETIDRYLVHQGERYQLDHYTNETIFPVKARISIVCRIFNERR